jgi:hypothetical protein
MDWSASVSRLETSIYLNFSALEELLHTYDDLFGSKQTLVVDKTLGCLCNAITDIMKRSSGTGREKIQRISTLKKIRSRLSDVKRWELDAASSCCQLSLITSRKLTAKISKAFWIWRSQTLEERNNDIMTPLVVDSDDSRDGYSNIPHSCSSTRLPPLPDLNSESIREQSSSDSSFHSESGLGDVDIRLSSFGQTPTELSDDDHPDLSVDVSDDSVDQDIQIEPSDSPSQSLSPNNSSYLASYLASPLRQKINDFTEEEDNPGSCVRDRSRVEESQDQDQDPHHVQIQDKYQEIEEDQIESQVTLDSLSKSALPFSNEGASDLSISGFINHESIPIKSPAAFQTSPTRPPVISQKRDIYQEMSGSTSISCGQDDPLAVSNSSASNPVSASVSASASASAIEIHWNEFSSSDEKSMNSLSPSEGRNQGTFIDDEEEEDGSHGTREFDQSEEDDELSKDELSDVIGSPNRKDLSEYSLSDVMSYLSLPLERTPVKSPASSSRTPSPILSEQIDQKEPSVEQQEAQQYVAADPTPTRTQKATPSRRVVSSTSVLTPRQSIPPPPPLHHPLAFSDSPPLP